MSIINREVQNSDVIPFVETGAFDEHPEAMFALGVIAVGEEPTPGNDDVMHGYMKLRWSVYGPQTQMVGEDHLGEDGKEKFDEDDIRSIHYGVIENHAQGPRLVASIRRILKDEQDGRPLPIEEFFPEAFEGNPAPFGSTEASRYIARHERAGVQRTLSHPLFAAYAAHVLRYSMEPTFGVVEPVVEADLKAKGVPLERIAEPVYVPEYAADNLGIKVDVAGFANFMEARAPGTLAAMEQTEGGFYYFGNTISKAQSADQVA